ncbi:phorbol esters/diacylglycerol binding domain protein [Teladorsagia circumcincta]|uniref:Phorbol esters/diacylglycerol binding domain protein n=1 Tax=Teladorsagia circumcincta TaxID=45464 RepID=A0A2G9U7X8_TELCI|nr:phorbol esters/diacylglycerol binding domain protein [Teladorsagia circumcincta]
MNHHRPTFCNYCREKLSGLTWHGWSCETCKMKAHKKCMSSIVEKCKWTIECTVPSHLQYISPENSIVAHQWVEGNLAMSSKCVVCEKVCGSVLKLAVVNVAVDLRYLFLLIRNLVTTKGSA